MFDNATPTAIVIFLAVVLMLTTIGSVIFFWTTGHPDDKAAIMSRFPWLFRHREVRRRLRQGRRSDPEGARLAEMDVIEVDEALAHRGGGA